MVHGTHIGNQLGDGSEPPSDVRRRARRVALNAEIMLRRSGRNNYRVTVYDISVQGCRVEFVERPNFCEVLWVKFDGLEALEAQVCWTRAPLAGLKFSRPMYPAVLQMLLRRLNGGQILSTGT